MKIIPEVQTISVNNLEYLSARGMPLTESRADVPEVHPISVIRTMPRLAGVERKNTDKTFEELVSIVRHGTVFLLFWRSAV